MVNKRADYAATQSLRRWAVDDPHVLALAERVRRGSVVLFIGSGASAGAGFPTWDDLLEELADRAGLDKDVREAVLRLPAPDAADVIGAGLGEQDLGTIIAERFDQDGFALTHGLLASLRVPEAVTTNYDRLYEHASRLPHQERLVVLPRSRRTADEPWLLKLHGDLQPSSSIVLTRDHYVRFDADSVPLASVVQSHMVTKHMLFVGYSLSDENFIRLARQVRQLFARTGTGGADKVGTVLSLFTDLGRESLWGEDLQFVTMTSGPSAKEKVPTAARELEIFLDDLAVASCDEASYVLDPRYADLLGEADRKLAAALNPLSQIVNTVPRSAAEAKVAALFGDLGREAAGSAIAFRPAAR